jgi:hypothetical protein
VHEGGGKIGLPPRRAVGAPVRHLRPDRPADARRARVYRTSRRTRTRADRCRDPRDHRSVCSHRAECRCARLRRPRNPWCERLFARFVLVGRDEPPH